MASKWIGVVDGLADELEKKRRDYAWQDIADAPKNGTRVIVAKWGWVHENIQDVKAAIGGDVRPKVWRLFFATTAHFLPDRGYWTDGLERLVEPTHFLVLPAAPDPQREVSHG